MKKRNEFFEMLEKEVSMLEEQGYKATNQQVMKGYLKGYKKLQDNNSALLAFDIDFTNETYHCPTGIDFAEDALQKFGTTKLVGFVVIEMVKNIGEVVNKCFATGLVEWNKEIENIYINWLSTDIVF